MNHQLDHYQIDLQSASGQTDHDEVVEGFRMVEGVHRTAEAQGSLLAHHLEVDGIDLVEDDLGLVRRDRAGEVLRRSLGWSHKVAVDCGARRREVVGTLEYHHMKVD